MKRAVLAALLCALFLSACTDGKNAAVTYSSDTSAVTWDTAVCETNITSAESVTGSSPQTEKLSETVSETITETLSETEAESAYSLSEPESSLTEESTSEASAEEASETDDTAASEVIDETDLTELLSTEETTSEAPAETTAISEMTALSSSAEKPAEIVIPKINTGHFSGKDMLENDLASVDISAAYEGVVKVRYSGSAKKVKVRITGGGAVYDYDLDPSGTVFPLQSGSGDYNIKVLENVSGKTYAIALDENFSADIENEFSPFLIPTQYINFNSSDKCVYKAAELCTGKKGTVDKAAAMFGYITDNISYDKELAANVKSGYIPDPDRTLSGGKGICFDYASLFASMCRSQGIPAKLVMGYVRGDVYHAWNEIYTEESGWVTVDLFLDGKGWELLDPTFYASASDKAEVAEYIGGGSDYSAVFFY